MVILLQKIDNFFCLIHSYNLFRGYICSRDENIHRKVMVMAMVFLLPAAPLDILRRELHVINILTSISLCERPHYYPKQPEHPHHHHHDHLHHHHQTWGDGMSKVCSTRVGAKRKVGVDCSSGHSWKISWGLDNHGQRS